ncbi:Aste57867_12147 [Aphanomyces stellatus]|uniref:Aste57867_12147 protein n=1 Tax=Aphanomyces stellatus TaxID=120398 RepID=A0A485KUR8_9STRA|nr:hypothetical protein As57867_012102 [Aphanomyces stellatus]VFT89001.1 Aste57867_12147 [Aphanomyces stellatus]
MLDNSNVDNDSIMETMVRGMDAVLQRVCRRLESLEAQVDALPQKVVEALEMDKLYDLVRALKDNTPMSDKPSASQLLATARAPSPQTPSNQVTSSFLAGPLSEEVPEARDTTLSQSHGSTARSSLPSTKTRWQFPAVSCRELWVMWFKGDPLAEEKGPLRFLATAQLEDNCKQRLHKARASMKWFVKAAIDEGLVLSEGALADMSVVDLEAVFDDMVARCTGTASTNDGGLRVHAAFQGLTFARAMGLTYFSLTKRLHKTTPNPIGTADTPKAATRPLFPSVPCRSLWNLWFLGGTESEAISLNGPFRLVDVSILVDETSKHRRYLAQRWIDRMTAIAVAHGIVRSVDALERLTDADDLEAVFDQTLDRFLDVHSDGTIGRCGFEQYTRAQVEALMFTTVELRAVRQTEPRTVPSHKDASTKSTAIVAEKESPVAYQPSPAHEPPQRIDTARREQTSCSSDEFPTTTCRHLWKMWFRGDLAVPQPGPVRRLDVSHLNPNSRDRYVVASRVVNVLVETALKLDMVQSDDELDDMLEDELMAVFDRAFGHILGLQTDGSLTQEGFQTRTWTQSNELRYTTIWPKLKLLLPRLSLQPKETQATILCGPTIIAPASATNATRLIPTESMFPVTSCRAMWLLWFQGDANSPDLGPFCKFVAASMHQNATIQSRIHQAQRVMDLIAQSAVDLALVPSADALINMSRLQLGNVFEQAFQSFLGLTKARGTSKRLGFQGLSYEEAIELTYTSVIRRMQGKEEANIKKTVLRLTTLPPNELSNDDNDSSARSAPDVTESAAGPIPVGWKLPPTTCRQLWLNWFFGDVSGVGPYRLLAARDFKTSESSRRRLSSARLVMAKLIEIANTHLFIMPEEELTELDGEDSLVVFERAFHVLMFNNPHGNLAGLGSNQIRPKRADDCNYTTVSLAMSQSASAKRMRAEIEESDSDDDNYKRR